MSAEWMTRVIVAGVAATAMLSMLTDGAASAEKKYKGTPYKWGGSAPQAGKGTDISPWTVTHAGRSTSKQKGKRPVGGSDRMVESQTQQGASRYQRSVTRRSNAAKKQDDTKKGIIQKMQ